MVMKMEGSSPTWGLSVPPAMLNPNPEFPWGEGGGGHSRGTPVSPTDWRLWGAEREGGGSPIGGVGGGVGGSGGPIGGGRGPQYKGGFPWGGWGSWGAHRGSEGGEYLGKGSPWGGWGS